MNFETNPPVGAGSVPNWFRAVCFALIVLLVHNPYLIAAAKAGGLNVSHHPSYRATVAASELQHFSPPNDRISFAVEVAGVFQDFAPLRIDARHPLVYAPQVLSPPPQFWSAGLWFRPPPASSL